MSPTLVLWQPRERNHKGGRMSHPRGVSSVQAGTPEEGSWHTNETAPYCPSNNAHSWLSCPYSRYLWFAIPATIKRINHILPRNILYLFIAVLWGAAKCKAILLYVRLQPGIAVHSYLPFGFQLSSSTAARYALLCVLIRALLPTIVCCASH